jgi:glycosyltransferase involved in cell wall biosynthesis
MNITVVLCTYNRAYSLATTLASIAAMTMSESFEWEVLVVDNNSSDRTRRVCEEFCRRYPDHFRYLFEPQQGLSNARNAGIRNAQGEIIAFTDDDVIVETTWLQSLTAELHDGQWAGAGGRILPQGTFLRPKWLSEEALRMGGVLPLFDLGATPGPLTRPPYGANMAYKKAIFDKYGFFRTDLGRQGETLISSEDAELGFRLLKAGELLRYEPRAVVYHAVSEERLQKRYFQDWWFGLGRSSVRLSGRKPNLWKIPRPFLSILRAVFLILGKGSRWLLSLQTDQRFFFKLQIWMLAGSILEFHSQLLRRNEQIRG